MKHEKPEKIRIIVAFGDIRNCTNFYESISNEEHELDPFLDEYDRVISWIEKTSGYKLKDTGDGFICIIELKEGHNCEVAIHLVHTLWKLLERVQKIIEEKEAPKPDGFRIRIACGYVRKKMKDGEPIYRGKHINLAHNLLEVSKDVGLICHDSFKQLMSEKQAKDNKFKFIRLNAPRKLPDSVSRRDASLLWACEVKPNV